MDRVKVIVERHADGYLAYPLGLKEVVAGHGATFEAALADVTAAVCCHVAAFGKSSLDPEDPVLEAFVAEVTLPAA